MGNRTRQDWDRMVAEASHDNRIEMPVLPTDTQDETIEEVGGIAVGDRVLSYDFPNRKDCYFTGTVTEITDADAERTGCRHYVIKTDGQVFEGKKVNGRISEVVSPPVNGVQSWLGGVTDGVIRI